MARTFFTDSLLRLPTFIEAKEEERDPDRLELIDLVPLVLVSDPFCSSLYFWDVDSDGSE